MDPICLLLSLCNKTCYRFGGFNAFDSKIYETYGQTYGNKLGSLRGLFQKILINLNGFENMIFWNKDMWWYNDDKFVNQMRKEN